MVDKKIFLDTEKEKMQTSDSCRVKHDYHFAPPSEMSKIFLVVDKITTYPIEASKDILRQQGFEAIELSSEELELLKNLIDRKEKTKEQIVRFIKLLIKVDDKALLNKLSKVTE